jgi:hypothetical protein
MHDPSPIRTTRLVKSALTALACLFLAAHLAFLPPTLEDIDSVNFALGVRDFDVARHQPHPPGYPVYIALAKVAAAVRGGAAEPRAVITGLAVWSALSGAALVVLLFALFRRLDPGDNAVRRAWWAMAVAVACPLFWFTALRPLSDMTGLAAAIAAQALIMPLAVRRSNRRVDLMLIGGAFVAGVAAGIRTQTVMLTAPLLLSVLTLPHSSLTWRTRLVALGAALAGVLIWAVPLLAASGGLGGYLTALGSQAGEDFTGVVMLWTSRSPRVAVYAAIYSFLWPWGSLILGGVVLGAAAIGALRLLIADRRALMWLTVSFGPYAVFHLLFHETATVRYALPLVVPIAYLAACAIDWTGPRPATAISATLIVVLLAAGAPAAREYGRAAAPSFAAIREIRANAAGMPVGMHAVFRRSAEWEPPGSDLLQAGHGREWLALVERWKASPDTSVAFLADPRRTDLALFDPRAHDLKASHRWAFPELPYMGGLRPGATDWYVMRPPGWMLDKGWALSAEIGGVAARDAVGPHVAPSVAWIRGRSEPSLLMIGGRNLDAAAAAQVTLARNDSAIDTWEVRPGFFFRLIPLAAGALDGGGYMPIGVRASSLRNDVRVSLEQFDLQPPGVPMVGFQDGWQEPEYNPTTARSWRWMSERASLWVRPVGREVTLVITGESPLRYFDSAPEVGVTLGGQPLTRFSPAADFAQEIRLPADRLEAAGGAVAIDSNHWFSPADRDGSADRRRLALRIYQVSVR